MARAALLVALAVTLAGCGRGGDGAAVRGVVEGFLAERSCDALSEDTRAELVREEGKPCPEAVGTLKLESGAVTRIQVDVEGAIAEIAGGETAFLARTPNGWRLSAVGCRATDGPPDRYPMNCELAP